MIYGVQPVVFQIQSFRNWSKEPAIIDEKWPINRVSSWYGWEKWGGSKYPDHMVSTYINNGWREIVERIKQEKERKKKAAAQKKVLDRVEGRNQQHTFGPSSSRQPANSQVHQHRNTPTSRDKGNGFLLLPFTVAEGKRCFSRFGCGCCI